MSDSRLVHAISLCLTQRTNNWTLYVFCCRGAGGTTGTTGRATMSNTAEWMTWCCSARSMRTPSWTTSRRDTWMTTSLYPLLTIAVHTPARNSWVPSHPCYSQNSWMVIHSVIVVIGQCWEVTPSSCARGQRASLYVPPPRPLTPAPSKKPDLL